MYETRFAQLLKNSNLFEIVMYVCSCVLLVTVIQISNSEKNWATPLNYLIEIDAITDKFRTYLKQKYIENPKWLFDEVKNEWKSEKAFPMVDFH